VFFRTAADDRPYHLGPFPLEALPRGEDIRQQETTAAPATPESQPQGPLGRAARTYRDLYSALAEGQVAAKRAPIPDDPARRAVDIKGYAYFMNAAQVGICRHGEEYAVVVLVEAERVPEPGNAARAWVEPAVGEVIDMRAAEIAVCVARHIRQLGFPARAHVAGNSQVDRERLAVLAGLALREGEALKNPFIDGRFALAAVTTTYELATDKPLAREALKAKGLRYWLGINGAMSGRERMRSTSVSTSGMPNSRARRAASSRSRSQMATTSLSGERWKPGGNFWRMVCSMMLGPANPERASGSAILMSPSMARLADTPPYTGSVITEI